MVIYSEQCLMQRSNVNVERHLKGPRITQIPDADCCLTHNCPQSILRELGLASLYGKISVHGKIIFLASVTDLMPSPSPLLLHLLLGYHALVTDSHNMTHD